MSAKILVIDPIPTNRITIGFKLRKAYYDVTSIGALDELGSDLLSSAWDLVIAACDNVVELQKLRSCIASKSTPIFVTYRGAAHPFRVSFLQNGAADVICKPISEQELFPKLRSLLRGHASRKELALREDTQKVFGLNEAPQEFLRPPHCIVLRSENEPLSLFDQAKGAFQTTFQKPETFYAPTSQGADCYIVCLSQTDPRGSLTHVLNMRAHPNTRHAAILVLADECHRNTALEALDLGANDILLTSYSVPEVQHRIAHQVDIKATNEKLRQSAQLGLDAALIDPLTNIYNRRYAMTHLKQSFEIAQSNGSELAVLMIDLDHFKIINDTFGHGVGDLVLKRVAHTLQTAVRASDMVARIGGEEFMIVLTDTTNILAQALAKRLCRQIANISFEAPDLSITASLGVRSYAPSRYFGAPQSGIETVDDLIKQADAALYAAKGNGRNQVAFYATQAA